MLGDDAPGPLDPPPFVADPGMQVKVPPTGWTEGSELQAKVPEEETLKVPVTVVRSLSSRLRIS